MAGLVATDEDVRIGARIRAARKAARVTGRAAAAAIGVSVAQLHKYEHGTNRISAVSLHQLARLLQMAVADFLDPPDWQRRLPEPVEDPAVRALIEAAIHLAEKHGRKPFGPASEIVVTVEAAPEGAPGGAP